MEENSKNTAIGGISVQEWIFPVRARLYRQVYGAGTAVRELQLLQRRAGQRPAE